MQDWSPYWLLLYSCGEGPCAGSTLAAQSESKGGMGLWDQKETKCQVKNAKRKAAEVEAELKKKNKQEEIDQVLKMRQQKEDLSHYEDDKQEGNSMDFWQYNDLVTEVWSNRVLHCNWRRFNKYKYRLAGRYPCSSRENSGTQGLLGHLYEWVEGKASARSSGWTN